MDVSLSSSEAEFYACSEAVKEIPFIVQVLEFMKVKVKKPIEVKVDNTGTIEELTTESVNERNLQSTSV